MNCWLHANQLAINEIFFYSFKGENTNSHSQSRVSYNGSMKHEHVKTRLDDKMTIQGSKIIQDYRHQHI